MHALHSGLDGKAYAEGMGRPQQSIAREMCAARVASVVPDIGYGKMVDRFSQLVEAHAAPSWLWPALVKAMLAKGWNVGERSVRRACEVLDHGAPNPIEAVERGEADFGNRQIAAFANLAAGASW